MRQETTPIPVHVIAGPLGVGKTTAILEYVRRQAGWQKIAVLVNDFGPVGLDGAILEAGAAVPSGDGLRIVNVPGGCVCCVGADGLMTGMRRLLKLPGIDRIIIEPSGIAMPAQIIDQLRALSSDHALDIRPIIVLLDAREFASGFAPDMPYYQRLIEAADVLIANRCDQAFDETIALFQRFAESLDPSKLRVLTTHHGLIPDDVFDLAPLPVGEWQGEGDEDHSHDDHQANGKTWPPELIFRYGLLEATIRDQLGKIDRFKGIFHTNSGWSQIEIARDELVINETQHRRDSRAEWITSGAFDHASFTQGIDSCRVD